MGRARRLLDRPRPIRTSDQFRSRHWYGAGAVVLEKTATVAVVVPRPRIRPLLRAVRTRGMKAVGPNGGAGAGGVRDGCLRVLRGFETHEGSIVCGVLLVVDEVGLDRGRGGAQVGLPVSYTHLTLPTKRIV